jgi:hypothetical protein
MIFGYTTLLIAFILSAVAAYYSVLGLTAIFAAAALPVIIMGGALETGKVISAMWLHKNWQRSPWMYKAYLVPSLLFLMLLTSMGTFGFLSKAHLDQAVPSGDIQAQVVILDERIATYKETIETARKTLRQLSDSVEQTVARTTDANGIDRAAQLRKGQARERNQLQNEIQASQTAIVKLQEQRAPIAASVRKIEAEVGPIKYIAALIYDNSIDADILEKSVRWVIILIVAVFDPLAIVLILAGTKQLDWAREDAKLSVVQKEVPPAALPIIEEVSVIVVPVEIVEPVIVAPSIQENSVELFDFEKHPYLFFADRGFTNQLPEPQSKPDWPTEWQEEPEVEEVVPEIVEEEIVEEVVPEIVIVEPAHTIVHVIREAYNFRAGEDPHHVVRIPATPIILADNDEISVAPSRAQFGIQFPDSPNKGDMFLKVDTLPSTLYKFNGSKWIVVDKSLTDNYVYNDEYIRHLVRQIELGTVSPDELSITEQEQIAEFLKK